jgi:hypothetical protein
VSRLRRLDPVLTGFTAAACALLAVLAAQVGDWAVMTDELLYQRLAISIAQTGSPLPTVHGELVDVYAQLYPLLLAPVFLLFDQPTAVIAAHAWNGVLMASAAVPAYLLARELALPRWMRYAAAVFTVALPWTVIAAFLMTEVAAYPAFLWALLAVQRAIPEPSDRRDLVAVVAIGAATLARPQLATLGPAFLGAALVHDLRAGKLRAFARRHRVLLVVTGVALLAALVSASTVLGSYAPVAEEGDLISGEVLKSAAVHLDVVGVAIGLVPLFVGLGWACERAVRGPGGPLHAFASLTALTTLVLTLEVGSVVTRFGLGETVKDRYLFYLAPLLFIATATALVDPRPRLVGLFAVCAFFVLTVGWESFEPVFGVNIDSPASALHEGLTARADDLGVETTTLVAMVGALVAVGLFFGLRRLRRSTLAAIVLAASALFTAAETAHIFDRLYASGGPSGRPLTQRPSDDVAWVDRAAPRGDVAIVPYSVGQDWWPSAVAWWDVEFWNESVTRAYMVGDRFTYTPESFPRVSLTPDPDTGAIGTEAPDYVARTVLDARFRPAGRQHAVLGEYELVEVEPPFRAAWVTTGVDADGWTRPDRPAAIRVFWPKGLTEVRVTLTAPEVETPRAYTVGAANAGRLATNESVDVFVTTCIPADGFADVPVGVEGATAIREIALNPPFARDFRAVGLRLSRISSEATGAAC